MQFLLNLVGLLIREVQPHINKVCNSRLFIILNSLASAWFPGFSKKKNASTHVALRGNFSSLVCSTGLVKVSKDAASLLVCTRKKIFCLGDAGFLSEVISGRLLGHLGPLCLALGANRSVVVFRCSFY